MSAQVAAQPASPCRTEAFTAESRIGTLGLVEEFLRGAEAIVITFTGKVSFNWWVCSVCVDGKDLATWIENKLTKADLCPDAQGFIVWRTAIAFQRSFTSLFQPTAYPTANNRLFVVLSG